MRYCGREFTCSQIDGIRQLIADHPTATRACLSRLVCEQIGWRRHDGRLKDMSCRVAMLRMQDDGLLRLPPPRNGNNNARFLILPWVRCHNLASCILGMAARRLPDDWQRRYGYRPVLLETFVERPRFRGTCYQAANWIFLGETKGRGKLDVHNQARLPKKAIWVHPLDKDFRRILSR